MTLKPIQKEFMHNYLFQEDKEDGGIKSMEEETEKKKSIGREKEGRVLEHKKDPKASRTKLKRLKKLKSIRKN